MAQDDRDSMLVAHTPGPDGEWHLLRDHAQAVAIQAAAAANRFDAGDLAWWIGILHDVGKASPAFQAYLSACAAQPERRFRSTDHKAAGALEATQFADFLAPLILGHHGGLPDMETCRHKLNEARAQDGVETAIARCTREGIIPPLPARGSLSLPAWMAETIGRRDPIEVEFFFRMLFSTLVDADHSDTERHFQPQAATRRARPLPTLTELTTRLQENQTELSATSATKVKTDQERDVLRIRADVYAACQEASRWEPGFFRLTVPTGGGKTRSSLVFALEHAVRHGLERVIVAVPYLTITDQTADVFRRIFPEERAILEHHSGVTARLQQDESGGQSAEELWRRLITQDWNAPIVVTTVVQLFESMFANAPAACRKLHRLAHSVIILDEAQTLPLGLLDPILSGLRSLVAHFGSGVVFCTATQPAFDDSPNFHGLPNIREIMPDPPALYARLARVRYSWPVAGGASQSWEEIAAAMRSESQILAIVNTRADALALFAALADPDAIHLSTLLCPAHRRELLQVIRNRLRQGKPVRVISTQVVEAGVDLDFPVVYRAVAPLDSIAQAAGRCNREGRLAAGQVVVFDPADGRLPPGTYRTGALLTQSLLGEGPLDLHHPMTFHRYFRELYRLVQSFDVHDIQERRSHLDFPEVAERFRVIDDDAVPLVVRYKGLEPRLQADFDGPVVDHERTVNDLLRRLAASTTLSGEGGPPRELMRQLQPYLVNRRRRAFAEDQRAGWVRDVGKEVFVWEGSYGASGIAAAIAPDDLLW